MNSYMSMNDFIRIFFGLFALLSTLPVPATSQSADLSLVDAVRAMALTQRIAVIDEDDRMTEEEYAIYKGKTIAEVRDLFSATGILDCQNNICSAQLIGDNRTITTSGHIFRDARTCGQKNLAKNCKFTYKLNGEERSIDVAEMLSTGFHCPTIPSELNDWAVLRLSKAALGVKPYRVPGEYDWAMEGHKVISVNGRSDDFYRTDPTTKKRRFPKSIEECVVKNTSNISIAPDLLESNCDGSTYSSGSSLIRSISGELVLVGITQGNFETSKQRELVRRTNRSEKRAYSSRIWSTVHVAVTGQFLSALHRATGGKSP